MRNAGDRTPGGSAGRRQRAAAPETSSRPGGNGGASLFTPAYRVSHGAPGSQTTSTGLSSHSSEEPASAYSWADVDARPSQAGYRRPGTDYEGAEPLWPGDAGAGADYGAGLDDDAW